MDSSLLKADDQRSYAGCCHVSLIAGKRWPAYRARYIRSPSSTFTSCSLRMSSRSGKTVGRLEVFEAERHSAKFPWFNCGGARLWLPDSKLRRAYWRIKGLVSEWLAKTEAKKNGVRGERKQGLIVANLRFVAAPSSCSCTTGSSGAGCN